MLCITISSISAQDTSNLATDNITDISTADLTTLQISDNGRALNSNQGNNVLGIGENDEILGANSLTFNPETMTTINYGEAFAITITGPSRLCELNITVDDNGRQFKLPFNGNARITNFDFTENELNSGTHKLTIDYPNEDSTVEHYTYDIKIIPENVPIHVDDVNTVYGQPITVVATGLKC